MCRLILFLLPVALSFAQQTPGWPDTFVGRLGALAVLETLNAEVLASRSATMTLEAWCRDHRLASENRRSCREGRAETRHARAASAARGRAGR